MKKSLFRLVLILSLVVLAGAFLAPSPVSAQTADVTLSCMGTGPYVIAATVNDTYSNVTVSITPLLGSPFTTVVAYIGFNTPRDFSFANANGTYRIEVRDNSNSSAIVFSQEITCPPPPPPPAPPQPGCEVGLPLTADAAVGRVVLSTLLYAAPGELISPPVALDAGKTLWVLGLNEAGTFYKAYLACSTVWLPVESLGPNYDEVWQGTPLPTTVVK